MRSKSRCFYAVALQDPRTLSVDVETSHGLPRVRLGAVTCEGARRWSVLSARFPRDLVTVSRATGISVRRTPWAWKMYVRVFLESPSLCCVSWTGSRAMQGASLCKWLALSRFRTVTVFGAPVLLSYQLPRTSYLCHGSHVWTGLLSSPTAGCTSHPASTIRNPRTPYATNWRPEEAYLLPVSGTAWLDPGALPRT
jgi:hypothetical protein